MSYSPEFQRKIRQPERMNFGWPRVLVWDFVPAELTSMIPIVLFLGIMPNPPACWNLAWQFYRRGRRVIMIDCPHGNFTWLALLLPLRGHAMAMLKIMEIMGIYQATAVTHSMGSITFQIIGRWLQRHGRRQIFTAGLLLEPSGTKRVSPFLLAGRSNAERRRDDKQQQEGGFHETWWPEGSSRDWKYYFFRTPLRTLAETAGISATSIVDGLRALVASRIRIGIVTGSESLVYPSNEILDVIGARNADVIMMLAGAEHQDPILRSEWYVDAIYPLLAALEKRQ